MKTVTVIGAGLAGSEAAWQLAERGISVRLFEMRPKVMSPAHKTGYFAELVCSNSLRSNALTNAVGVLKEELRRMNSLIMKMADAHAVPAGSALAVDREGFAKAVSEAIRNHPLIEVIEEEMTEIPDGPVIVASGPLTSDALLHPSKICCRKELFIFTMQLHLLLKKILSILLKLISNLAMTREMQTTSIVQ